MKSLIIALACSLVVVPVFGADPPAGDTFGLSQPVVSAAGSTFGLGGTLVAYQDECPNGMCPLIRNSASKVIAVPRNVISAADDFFEVGGNCGCPDCTCGDDCQCGASQARFQVLSNQPVRRVFVQRVSVVRSLFSRLRSFKLRRN